MKVLRARIVNGNIVPDEPSGLPEGAVVDVAVLDEGSELDADEREALDAAITESHASLHAGEGIPAAEVLRERDTIG
jgi:hypothetical protein